MRKVSKMKLMCLLLLFTASIKLSEERARPRIIRLVGKSADVGDIASQLTDFFGFGGIGGDDKVTSEELLETIDMLIKASQTSILSALLETTKLERIYDAVIAIHSSMKDLRLVVRAKAADHYYEIYKREFVTNYRETEIIKHIRFLPELLTYTIPGFDVPLLVQVRDKTKCERTAFGDFRGFYVNLLSNGIALHATFEEFTKNVTLEHVFESEWDDSLRSVQADFDRIEGECYDELYQRAMRSCTSGSERGKYGLSLGVLAIGLVTWFMATSTGTPLLGL